MGSYPQWHYRLCCQLEDVHNKDLLKLQKFITQKRLALSNFVQTFTVKSSWPSLFTESMWMSEFHSTLKDKAGRKNISTIYLDVLDLYNILVI